MAREAELQPYGRIDYILSRKRSQISLFAYCLVAEILFVAINLHSNHNTLALID